MVGKNLLEHVHAGAFELLTPSSAELALLDAQNVLSVGFKPISLTLLGFL